MSRPRRKRPIDDCDDDDDDVPGLADETDDDDYLGRSFQLKKCRRAQKKRASNKHEQESNKPEQESRLASVLFEDKSMGHITLTQMQRYAAGAVEDGRSHPSIKGIAGIGSAGQYKNHLSRDFGRLLLPVHMVMCLMSWKVHFASAKHTLVEKSQTIALPHVFFAVMYQYYRTAFDEYILGGEECPGDFWRSQIGSPQYEEHPLRDRSAFQTRAIPITLHGDALPVAGQGSKQQKSSECYSWSSMLSRATCSLFMNWFIWSFVKQLKWPPSKRASVHNTRNEFMRVLAWSLKAMWLGRFPTNDHTGRAYTPDDGFFYDMAGLELAEGFFAVLWGIRGDLEFFAEMDMQNFNSNDPCICCNANVSTRPFTDHRREEQASWSSWTADSWEEAFTRRHILFRMLPGLTIYAVMIDWMHCKHLGVNQYFFGSLLHYICHDVLPYSPKVNCDAVCKHMLKYFKDS